MSASPDEQPEVSSVLIVDGEIVARHVIAEYLRHCGYAAIEAASIDEAMVALSEATLTIDIILCEVTTFGSGRCFELATWVRTHRPELEVKLVGSLEMAAQTAAELCETGPHLKRPYEPLAVVDYVKRLRASRVV